MHIHKHYDKVQPNIAETNNNNQKPKMGSITQIEQSHTHIQKATFKTNTCRDANIHTKTTGNTNTYNHEHKHNLKHTHKHNHKHKHHQHHKHTHKH